MWVYSTVQLVDDVVSSTSKIIQYHSVRGGQNSQDIQSMDLVTREVNMLFLYIDMCSEASRAERTRVGKNGQKWAELVL